MKAYRLSGTFYMRPDEQPFTLEVAADSEDQAREYAYSIIGSRHRAKRDQIHIYHIDEITPDEVEDPAVANAIDGGPTGREEE